LSPSAMVDPGCKRKQNIEKEPTGLLLLLNKLMYTNLTSGLRCAAPGGLIWTLPSVRGARLAARAPHWRRVPRARWLPTRRRKRVRVSDPLHLKYNATDSPGKRDDPPLSNSLFCPAGSCGFSTSCWTQSRARDRREGGAGLRARVMETTTHPFLFRGACLSCLPPSVRFWR
jgi:hypothetical protein